MLPAKILSNNLNLYEGTNGHDLHRGDRRLCRDLLGADSRLRQAEGRKMNLFYVIGSLTSAGLLVYLLAALLKE